MNIRQRIRAMDRAMPDPDLRFIEISKNSAEVTPGIYLRLEELEEWLKFHGKTVTAARLRWQLEKGETLSPHYARIVGRRHGD